MKTILVLISIVVSLPVAAQWTTVATNHIRNTNTGNVGIGTGTTTPVSKLTVFDGDIRIKPNDANGTNRMLIFDASSSLNYAMLVSMRRNDVLRWQFGATGNAGVDDLEFFRHSNTGTFLGRALTLQRATGNAIFPNAVCIGTSGATTITNPGSFKLAVDGWIGAREVQVMLNNPWPDFVFESEYELADLSDVKSYIDANKHLPGIPSQAEVEKNGHELGKMDALLLQKIEELTLYLINLKEENEKLRDRVEVLETNK